MADCKNCATYALIIIFIISYLLLKDDISNARTHVGDFNTREFHIIQDDESIWSRRIGPLNPHAVQQIDVLCYRYVLWIHSISLI